MTIVQFSQKRAKREEALSAKIAAEIEVMEGIQSEVNAVLGNNRKRATKQQALIAKVLANLESQMKAAEKLETLKKIEASMRQELANLNDIKKKSERLAVAKAKKTVKAQEEKELLQVIRNCGLELNEIKEKLEI